VGNASIFSKNRFQKNLVLPDQLENNKKDIKYDIARNCMKERSMRICFTADQYAKIEQAAKQKGMLNASQLIEEALSEQ